VFFPFRRRIVNFSQYFRLVQGRSPIAAGLDVSTIVSRQIEPIEGRDC
jgi:hypothetical protein